ncbi:hypothetical protein MC7420_4638 [Coleofasciculus chthonoplastes PCC 7420]|uniref:Uncharacterized protein n=1 Tax=Coleofasciculus chthonoplastes PCC 7420 TaxID=118168 RepID=B4VP57_9CYAN|nr:hypothetical protein MC7420_4638 [Coleofasciculus chthonoplastes PCC 7420]
MVEFYHAVMHLNWVLVASKMLALQPAFLTSFAILVLETFT